MEKVEGKGIAHLKVNEGLKALADSVEQFTKDGEDHYTRLVQDLKGTDPDDAFSSIPYEKGMSFLWYLQGLVGEDAMNTFILAYVKAFRFQVCGYMVTWKRLLASVISRTFFAPRLRIVWPP